MINITQKKQMLKKELNSNAALITKSLLLNKNIVKSLFESLQTKFSDIWCFMSSLFTFIF